ncbi:MAG: hypothetical protein R3C45_10145 [Phycisphaerales bacterium]
MKNRNQSRLAGTIAVLCCAVTATTGHAQIVGDVAGEIDLRLNPFFDTFPGTGEPTVSQVEIVPIGFADVTASIDGTGYYSAGGLSEIRYGYESGSPGAARFDIHAIAESLGAGDANDGSAAIAFDFTVTAPIRYRFEADAIGTPLRYEVSLNNQYAYARYDAGTGLFEGTFPFLYFNGNPLPTDWDTYVDQGVLPAGTYHLWVSALSSIYRSSSDPGLASEGTASLTIQLLGDADLDGVVGQEDLNAVLNAWNQTGSPGNWPQRS